MIWIARIGAFLEECKEEHSIAILPGFPTPDVEDRVAHLRHSADEPPPVVELIEELLEVSVLESGLDPLDLEVAS